MASATSLPFDCGRSRIATLAPRLASASAVARPEARRPADDDGLLPRDLHLAPFPKSARFVKQAIRRHFSVRLSGGRIGTLGRAWRPVAPGAMAGVAAAAVALGVTQLVAAFVRPGADSRTAVGSTVIDLTPGPVKEWAITDVRHGRQALPDAHGAGGDRRRRRGRRVDGRRAAFRSAARRSSWPGSPDARRCCRARARRSSTSSPRASARCAASWCCAC